MKLSKVEQINFLHIEDDEVDAILFRKTFAKFGLTNPIVNAEDGEEALELLNSKKDFEVLKPFLIFLDLNMPRMGGIQFLKTLREDPKLRSAIVFVLTTSENTSDIKNCYDLNVAGYLLKGHGATNIMGMHAQMVKKYLSSIEF